ncbi:MAG TPA: hypothetical protein DEF00_05195 [Candidatus Taylorbacteria bacterium]|nr:MAG: hypothetical protein UY03_C0015G0006 [Parcubacteria group bacterium GW2011_GWA2_47_64]KKU97239.1 MAG: hypothetical protein UY29_C0001G0033 [Parcubacteria group bacterium GW2011_GWC2_48_17]HBV01743.1 hypothetical protein [Candidatus Taylorbacteria bacterium]
MLKRAKSFIERNERRLSILAFSLGFLWDSLTLTSVDGLFDNIVLLSYIVVAFASIMLLNAPGARNFQSSLARRGVNLAEFLLPFSFGGLFSGFLIFYSRSGPLLSSAPFLLFILLLFLGNEFFRRHYERFIFQMSVFFVALFSYVALIIPVLLGRMGDMIFLLSGVVTLFLFWCALKILSLISREEIRKSKFSLLAIVISIFVTFNFLYWSNMIPPIPLSLKEIGIYHNVERTRSGEYRLTFEKAPWYAFGQKTSAVFHRQGSMPIYAFSSVFAPTRLLTEVAHRWAYFDDQKDRWIDSTVVGFPISGGRENGFRGYSKKETISPGKWRVDVETLRGQTIGRFVFEVIGVSPPPLKEETR